MNISDAGNIIIYTGSNREQYLCYSQLPTKIYRDYYTLEDININGQALHGEHVNLLVAVKKVGISYTDLFPCCHCLNALHWSEMKLIGTGLGSQKGCKLAEMLGHREIFNSISSVFTF